MEELVMAGDDRYTMAGAPGMTFYAGVKHDPNASLEEREKHSTKVLREIDEVLGKNDILVVISKAIGSNDKLVINIPDNQHIRDSKRILQRYEGKLLDYVEVKLKMKPL